MNPKRRNIPEIGSMVLSQYTGQEKERNKSCFYYGAFFASIPYGSISYWGLIAKQGRKSTKLNPNGSKTTKYTEKLHEYTPLDGLVSRSNG